MFMHISAKTVGDERYLVVLSEIRAVLNSGY